MSTCTICRSQNLHEVDGLYYCNDCGTQNVGMREVDTENTIGQLRIRQPRQKLDEEKHEDKKTTRKSTHVAIPEHEIRADVDYPKYLSQVGRRLATATYILTRISYKLHTDFKVPESVVDYANNIFQSYLCATGVAFTDYEIATLHDQCKVIMAKTQVQLRKDIQQATKKRKEKEKRKSQLQNMSQWELSAMDPSELEVNEDEQEYEVEPFQEFETTLSINAVKVAARVYLHLDLLLNIIYLACHCVGVRWILLTELHRWNREDRFGITRQYLLDLNFARDPKQVPTTHSLSLRSWKYDYGIEILSKLYWSLSFLVQSIKIPMSVTIPSMETMFRRFIFDLNLPPAIWSRIQIVMHFLPAPTAEFTSQSLSNMRTAKRNEDLRRAILGMPKCFASRYPNSYMKAPFGAIERKTEADRFNQLVCMPPETKAMAVILLALKLMFILDDKTEFELAEKNKENREFDFTAWLQQLTMRNLLRKGNSANHLLNSNFNLDFFFDRLNTQSLYHYGTYYCPVDVRTVIPPHSHTQPKKKAFYQCFAFNRTTMSKNFFQSDLAKYAPIRAHGELGQKVDDKDPKIDARRLKILNHDFNRDHVEYENLPNDVKNENDDELSRLWQKMFPCFRRYKSLPVRNRKSPWRDKRPLFAFQFFKFRFRDEQIYLSESFKSLLFQLAATIGEGIEVLYFCFTFVEICFMQKSTTTVSENGETDELYLSSDFDLSSNEEQNEQSDSTSNEPPENAEEEIDNEKNEEEQEMEFIKLARWKLKELELNDFFAKYYW
ncbi:hypothetical protein M3Y98_01090500 [Aphelenchoides besseyi]|nr:hypothetical protein M3Y98_01090500 [Aphelenchoides besseyi]KAI6209419.1 hypothetical protein M3Y96_00219600 [Aphelenchoides besseyi]